MNFGILYREFRERKQISQREIARRMEGQYDRSYIVKLETGGQDPSLKALVVFIQALNLDSEEKTEFIRRLIFENDRPPKHLGFRSDDV